MSGIKPVGQPSVKQAKSTEQILRYNKKIKVGSPGALHWELKNFLVEHKYTTKQTPEELPMKDTPIGGIASFASTTEGNKYFPKWSIWRLIIGILLLLTILLIPLGIWLIRKSRFKLCYGALIKMEGESYRAGAKTQDPYTSTSEVLSIVSDARLTLLGEVWIERLGKKKKAKQIDWQELEKEFNAICASFEQLLPKLQLPEVIPPK